METKHTPGPWKIGTQPPNGEQTIGTYRGLMVAVATTGAGTPTIANARLIAAAPELLDALLDAACALECCGKDYYAATKARAAIAKATGNDG